MIVINELEKTRKEAVVACFKALSRHLPRGTKVIYENRDSVGGPAKVRTEHIPNTSKKHYLLGQL
jgi:hypothetical protein